MTDFFNDIKELQVILIFDNSTIAFYNSVYHLEIHIKIFISEMSGICFKITRRLKGEPKEESTLGID